MRHMGKLSNESVLHKPQQRRHIPAVRSHAAEGVDQLYSSAPRAISRLSQPLFFLLESWATGLKFLDKLVAKQTFYLIAEYLDLADGAVHQLAASIAVVISVYLEVQRDTFHSLLGGEVSAQAIHPNKHLQTGAKIDTACRCCKHYPQAAMRAVGRNNSSS